MTNRTRSRRGSKKTAAKRAKTSSTAAIPDAEMETTAAETTAIPQAFSLQTMFKDAKAAPEGFNGIKGFVDGSTTKACIRLVPPEAYSDGKINWDHPDIVFVDLAADLNLHHVKTAIRLNGAHNGFWHRLLLGIELVGIDDWLGLAKESAGADADVNSGKICSSEFDFREGANDTVVLATIPQAALADSTWGPAAQGVWATLMAQKNAHVVARERELAAAATLQRATLGSRYDRHRAGYKSIGLATLQLIAVSTVPSGYHNSLQ